MGILRFVIPCRRAREQTSNPGTKYWIPDNKYSKTRIYFEDDNTLVIARRVFESKQSSICILALSFRNFWLYKNIRNPALKTSSQNLGVFLLIFKIYVSLRTEIKTVHYENNVFVSHSVYGISSRK